MTYYIFKEQIFTLFLSLSHLTLVSFPDKVQDYAGGQKGDFQTYEINHKRSLIFKPKKKGFKRNFITFLKDSRYHFNLVYSDRHSNPDIEIKAAQKCNYFTLIKKTKNYQLFECPKSLFFINTSKTPLKVNGRTIQGNSYLSKGPPIFVNGKMIYYQGRVL